MKDSITKRETFWVNGLDCGEEVLLLKQALSKRPGIVEVEFDLINARMFVTYDNNVITTTGIQAAVSGTGLKAVSGSNQIQQAEQSWWDRNGRNLSTMTAAILLIAGFLVHAFMAKSVAAAFGYGAEAETADVPLAAILCYSASIGSGIWFVLPKAWGALLRIRPDMNLLMTLAVIGAVFLGEWLEAATVTFLFALALLLEHWSMGRTRKAIASLLDLTPPMARCFDPNTNQFIEKPVEDVSVGSTVIVRPHEKIPLDGIVLKGTSSVNQAPITGESVPVSKQPGDEVFAGTINEEGTLEFDVTRPAADTTLARIVHLVQEAHARRAPSEQWVETFARYYTPAMMLLALSIALVPPLYALWRVGSVSSLIWADWFYRALVVLVVACPCALVISTPVSIVSALTAAVRHGVLIKGGRVLEAMTRIKAMALDKTGTITYGRPVVQQILAFNGHNDLEVLARAAFMEMDSQHPFARAILKRAGEEGILPSRPENYRVLTGRGAEGTFGGKKFWIGSHRLMHETGGETPEIHERAVQLEDAGHSVVAVGNENHVCGLIGIADDVREQAAGTISALKSIGVQHIAMLTGDNEETARAVAQLAGIESYHANLLPEDKVSEVQAMQAQHGPVAMVGDGVNDAPALAAASVGIAMAAMGTDTAIETADVALMSDDLAKLPWLILHSHRTLRTVKQNISFALGLKLLFILLTFFGAASLWAAIAADMGASLLVIFNGLRLLKA
jgi:Cd2+/Zn2+-exporting ATPase